MTISPGAPWGRSVARPVDLVTVPDDPSLAAALADRDGPPVSVAAGDLARTLGVASRGPTGEGRGMVHELPIDLLEVRLDDRHEPLTACAHVIARSPWTRGHWWRGPIVAVMNAEFVGEWDVAPRGHPNDGRAEVVEVDPAMSMRQRGAARRRLGSATHVPHPRIATRSVRSSRWTFPYPLVVLVDGRAVGRSGSLSVEVRPDAAIVYA